MSMFNKNLAHMIQGPTDAFIWHECAHEQEIFECYEQEKEWKWKKSVAGCHLVVKAKIYKDFLDNLLLNHKYFPRTCVRINKKGQPFDDLVDENEKINKETVDVVQVGCKIY